MYGDAQGALNLLGGALHPSPTRKAASDARQAEYGVAQCAQCGAKWTGLSRAHCSGCHATFASVGLFDRHRSTAGEHGACHNPATIINSNTGERVMFFRAGMWRSPELTEEQKLAAFGSRGGDR